MHLHCSEPCFFMMVRLISSCYILAATLIINHCWAESSFPDPSILYRSYLGGDQLDFKSVEKGDTIPLNSLIAMPATLGGQGGFLKLEFRRSDISETFVQDFFFVEDSLVRKKHPFAYLQMETILKDESIIVIVHDGVLWNLRNDIKNLKDYKTFKNENVVARVLDVRGDVLCSWDHEVIRDKLHEFYIKVTMMSTSDSVDEVLHLSNGTIAIWKSISPDEVPRMYTPIVDIEYKMGSPIRQNVK